MGSRRYPNSPTLENMSDVGGAHQIPQGEGGQVVRGSGN